MPSQGPLSPSSAFNGASGDVAWTNPTNVFTSNDAYATAAVPANGLSGELVIEGFGASISLDATIQGFVVELEKKKSAGTGSVVDLVVQLEKAGVLVGVNKADTVTPWGGSDAYSSYGSASDLWGASWTPADVNGSTFGLRVQANEDTGLAAVTAAIDHARITAYFGALEPVIMYPRASMRPQRTVQ